MPRYETVEVSQEDIDAGTPRHPEKCALALAITRQFQSSIHYPVFDFRGIPPVNARPGSVRIGITIFRPSDRLNKFLHRFDTNPAKCKPGRFRLFYE